MTYKLSFFLLGFLNNPIAIFSSDTEIIPSYKFKSTENEPLFIPTVIRQKISTQSNVLEYPGGGEISPINQIRTKNFRVHTVSFIFRSSSLGCVCSCRLSTFFVRMSLLKRISPSLRMVSMSTDHIPSFILET